MDCFGQTIGFAKNLMQQRRKNCLTEKSIHHLVHVLIQLNFLVLCIGNQKKKQKCLRLTEKPKHIIMPRRVHRKIVIRQNHTSSTFYSCYIRILIFSAWLLKAPLDEHTILVLCQTQRLFCLPCHLTCGRASLSLFLIFYFEWMWRVSLVLKPFSA